MNRTPAKVNSGVRILRFLPLVLFLALAMGLYFGLEYRKTHAPDELRSVLIGKPFPAFQLPELHTSEPMDVSLLTNGEVTLVNVWASWCPTCRFEHPYLEDLAERGLRVVGLNYKDNPDNAKQWLLNYGDPYSLIIHDLQGTLGLDLGVYGAPENFLIGPDGVIQFKRVGMVDDVVWREQIEPLYLELGGEPLANAVSLGAHNE